MSKSTSKNNVSYKLLNRNIIDETIDAIINSSSSKVVENNLAVLSAMENEQILDICIQKVKKLVLEDITESQIRKLINLLSVLVEFYTGQAKATKELKSIIQTANVHQQYKLLLMSFLMDMGTDIEELTSLINPDEIREMADFASRDLISLVDGKLEEHLLFLEEFEEFEIEDQEEIMSELVRASSDNATEMLGILANSFNRKISEMAIKALGRNLRPITLNVLKELSNIKDESVSNAATKELSDLIRSGYKKPSKKDWSKPLGELYDVIISTIDGMGSRLVWLVWRIPNRKNQLIGLNIMINTNVGIKNCFSTPSLTKKELEKYVQDFSMRSIVMRGNYQYALTLIRDALDKSLAINFPLPLELAFWRRCLGAEFYRQKYLPVLDTLMPSSETEIQNRLNNTALLFDHEAFDSWFETGPEIEASAKEIQKLQLKHGNSPNFETKAISIEKKLIKKVIRPNLSQIKERLILTIDFLNTLGEIELAKDAMVCLITLDKIPLENHPFISRMAYESIIAATFQFNEEHELDF